MGRNKKRSAGEREINPVPVLRAVQVVFQNIATQSFFYKYKDHLPEDVLLKSMMVAFNNHYPLDEIDAHDMAEKAASLGIIYDDEVDDYTEFVVEAEQRWWFVNEFEKKLMGIDKLASMTAYQYQLYV